MNLLQLVFARLNDNEIRKLSPAILEKLQGDFLLSKEWQIELLGRVLEKINPFCTTTFECLSDGTRNGWHIVKLDNSIIEIGEYKNNSPEGELKCYKLNKSASNINQLIRQSYYKNGLINGEEKEWYPNGQLEYIQIWRDDLWNGPYIKWRDNGIIECQGSWRNDKMDGKWRNFYKNRQLMTIEKYNNGELIKMKNYNIYGELIKITLY